MYHVECIDIHKAEGMYLYIDRACLCANNMYNAANFHIRNLMTGLKKDISLRTENEKSVIRTFTGSIPVINFFLRVKRFVKIFRPHRKAEDPGIQEVRGKEHRCLFKPGLQH